MANSTTTEQHQIIDFVGEILTQAEEKEYEYQVIFNALTTALGFYAVRYSRNEDGSVNDTEMLDTVAKLKEDLVAATINAIDFFTTQKGDE